MAEVKYKKAIERLDEIIGKIESDDIDVDDDEFVHDADLTGRSRGPGSPR